MTINGIKKGMIQKRDGNIIVWDREKIAKAIQKAFAKVGRSGAEVEVICASLAKRVEKIADEKYGSGIPTVENIQDIVEEVLINERYADVAKEYITYRQKRNESREIKNLFMDAESMIDNYLGDLDWKVNENSNMGFSLQGLNNSIVDKMTAKYWLNKIYRSEHKDAHEKGDLHIHDLGLLAPYCCGWDLEAFLRHGFTGARGKVEAKPPKHLATALGQLVNILYTLQGESAGAQAVSSIDTYMAPFIRYDNLTYHQVKKEVQRFVFNLNIPTRVGFQTPFTNITLDIAPHPLLKDKQVIIGGVEKEETYADFQAEMDMFNKAYCEVMMEGDGMGRIFSFPIPTVNVTKEFPWDSEVVESIMEMTRKFGTPYFANFVNSDLKPEDARSMCCRLRLDNRELRKRGGGLFGSAPLTGSINVVTLNMARIGYLAETKEEFLSKVYGLMETAKEICELKRKALEQYMEAGLYPYSRFFLKPIKEASGQYFKNHFSTIGLNGMNEAILNFMGKDIATPEGQDFAEEVMDFMNEAIVMFQEETDSLFNLEATPAEGTGYRFARLDQVTYPGIIQQGEEAPYYTNSTQLPVGHTTDIFEAIELQERLQTKYTGGTVLHGFLGEALDNTASLKLLIQRTMEFSEIPYFTISPTFSMCPVHGYINGEHFICPTCGATEEDGMEVWTRVVGFHRPTSSWNPGKKSEYRDRVEFEVAADRHIDLDKVAV